MLDRQPRPLLVVGHEAGRLGIVGLRIDVETRDAEVRHVGRRPPVGAARGDHQPVDPLAQELLEMLPLALRIVGGVAHEHGDALVGEARLEPLHDRQGEAAEAVGGDHPDRQALAAVQACARSLGRKPSFERRIAHLARASRRAAGPGR